MPKPIIFGISGLTLTEAERDLFLKNQVTGFILFKRNIADPQQLTELVKSLKGLYLGALEREWWHRPSLRRGPLGPTWQSSFNPAQRAEKSKTGLPRRYAPRNDVIHNYEPLILIDQEGGRVARLRPPLVPSEYKPASYFGDMYDKGKDIALSAVQQSYSNLMYDLRKYNIDSPCSPVADLLYEQADNVIGDRSFGNSIPQVIDLCIKTMKGIEQQGGIPIIKHIPGHGRATCDSHLALPIIDASLEELNRTDFEVFRQLSKDGKAKWAMTAHVLFEALDPLLPVTISPKAISFIRNEIGFKGILVTDDIAMLALHGEVGAKYASAKKPLTVFEEEGAASNQDLYEFATVKAEFVNSVARVAVESLEAGCDLVLHCNGDIEEMKKICEMVELGY